MYEKHNETIKARVFLEALQSDATSIIFTNCIIEGVVDIFSVALERDENDRILLNKSLSCIGCTFKNIVNFRTVVFEKDVDFRRTLFEADLDLDETILHGSCAFREAIFQRRADFHSAIFHKSASFWRARFHNVADFHRVEFRRNAYFMRLISTMKSIFGAPSSKVYLTVQEHGFLKRQRSIMPHFSALLTLLLLSLLMSPLFAILRMSRTPFFR